MRKHNFVFVTVMSTKVNCLHNEQRAQVCPVILQSQQACQITACQTAFNKHALQDVMAILVHNQATERQEDAFAVSKAEHSLCCEHCCQTLNMQLDSSLLTGWKHDQ